MSARPTATDDLTIQLLGVLDGEQHPLAHSRCQSLKALLLPKQLSEHRHNVLQRTEQEMKVAQILHSPSSSGPGRTGGSPSG